MFADLIDIGFDEVLKMIKEHFTYIEEMEDDEYSDLYERLMKTPFKDYKRFAYYKRSSWPDNIFLRPDILINTDSGTINVPEEYEDLSAKEIIDKLEDGEIKLTLYLIYCNIDDDIINEDHIILVHHVTSPDDLLAEDWCVYVTE